MRLIRAYYEGRSFYGALAENQIYPLDKELKKYGPIPFEKIQILPLVVPTKIICVGLNFKAHAKELGMEIPEEPMLFLKPPSSVISTGENIIYPRMSKNVHYEGELALVIGKMGKNISVEEAPDYILGFTCANDVTARDLQQKDSQFTRAKGFDTFCPVGPWIETEFREMDDLLIRTKVNDEIKQEGRTSDMIVNPYELVSYISSIMTLMPGDVILTGTPPGVGEIHPGDEVHVEIEGLGTLINKVVKEED
jgi:2-keto-4-pentenoate hydratase/2-oxohepta-3-ene-1,7-dioic acid hydratase in catechol pathway